MIDKLKETYRVFLDKPDIYEKYVQLLRTNDPDEVDKIMGNSDWTYLFCRECRGYKSIGIEFHLHSDGITTICLDCILEAIKLIFEKKNENRR